MRDRLAAFKRFRPQTPRKTANSARTGAIDRAPAVRQNDCRENNRHCATDLTTNLLDEIV
jgi:hypothetical protein